MRMFRNNLTSIAMLPLFVLANVICICTAGMSAVRVDVVPAATHTTHSCCEKKTSPAHEATPAPTAPHHNDSACPHCGHGGQWTTTASSDATVVNPPAPVTLFALFTENLVTNDSLATARNFLRDQGDRPPPRDVLQMKCALQI